MSDDMLRRLMKRLHRRHAARQVAIWKQNVKAASRKFNHRVGSVTLSDWQAAYVMKGIRG